MAFEKASRLLQHCLNSPPTYSWELIKVSSLKTTEILGSTTRLVYSLTVPEVATNLFKTMHGGAISTLIDELTTHAIYTADSKSRASVSLELNVSFLEASKAGETLTVIADCSKVGAHLAFSTAEVYSNDRLVAQGKHTKYLLNRPMLDG